MKVNVDGCSFDTLKCLQSFNVDRANRLRPFKIDIYIDSLYSKLICYYGEHCLYIYRSDIVIERSLP